jgi:hypothetical protein
MRTPISQPDVVRIRAGAKVSLFFAPDFPLLVECGMKDGVFITLCLAPKVERDELQQTMNRSIPLSPLTPRLLNDC